MAAGQLPKQHSEETYEALVLSEFGGTNSPTAFYPPLGGWSSVTSGHSWEKATQMRPL